MFKTRFQTIQDAQKIDGWMKPIELEGLYELAQKYIGRYGRALEVGSWKGRSSLVLAEVCRQKGAMLTCLDTFTGSELNEAHYQEALNLGADKFMETYIKNSLHNYPVNYIVGNSTEKHRELHDNLYDLVFIDGNHCYPVIGYDLDNFYPKLKSKGVFICHDYADVCPDVKQAVNDKFGLNRIEYFYESLIGIIKE